MDKKYNPLKLTWQNKWRLFSYYTEFVPPTLRSRIKPTYNKDWDNALRIALANGHRPSEMDDKIMTLNGLELWINDFPHHYGYVWRDETIGVIPEQHIMRPSFKTILLLRQMELREQHERTHITIKTQNEIWITQMIIGEPYGSDTGK